MLQKLQVVFRFNYWYLSVYKDTENKYFINFVHIYSTTNVFMKKSKTNSNNMWIVSNKWTNDTFYYWKFSITKFLKDKFYFGGLKPEKDDDPKNFKLSVKEK